MFQVKEFILYKLRAKNKHGIHSPFVFEFVVNCLSTKVKKKSIQTIQTYKKVLLSNKNTVLIDDLGAGSRFLSSHRTVKSIAKTSASKGRYAKLLYQLAHYYKPQHILELGTNVGVGTLHLALGNPTAKICTVEGDLGLMTLSKELLQKHEIQNVNIVHASFLDFFETYSGPAFDFVFVDGHHDGDALLNYMQILEKFTHNDTIFVLDDIRWSKGMFEAWKKLHANQNYHVSIDLYKMGIIIPRIEQVKEHFVIRLKNILLSL
jgi:predicted O-methyltransferase YrrM